MFSDLHLLSGPYDVGGQCPSPSYEYVHDGVDYCCCDNECCWDKCSLSPPPEECLENIPNSQWVYSKEHGYFQAFQTRGNTYVILQFSSSSKPCYRVA